MPLLPPSPARAQAEDQGPAARQPGQDDASLATRRERLRRKWEAQFRAADTDHDGFLSLPECRAAGFPAAIIDHFQQIDSDGDGKLSPAELWALYDRRLQAQQPQPAAP